MSFGLAPESIANLENVRHTLEGASDYWSGFLEIATVVVVVGVVVEVVATMLEVRDEFRGGHAIRVHHILTFLGGALVVLAVTGEFWAERRAASLETALRQNNAREQTILLERQTAATAQAVEAVRKLGSLNQFVRTKTRDVDADIFALMVARERARAELAEIGPLMKAEQKLSAAQRNAESNISDLASKTAALKGEAGDLKNEAEGWLDALTPRTTLFPIFKKIDGQPDIPIYLVAGFGADTKDLSKALAIGLNVGQWKVGSLPDEQANIWSGVRVAYFSATGPAQQTNSIHQTASSLCVQMNSIGIFSGVDPIDAHQKSQFDFNGWPKDVPSDAILVRVGANPNIFRTYRQLAKMMGSAPPIIPDAGLMPDSSQSSKYPQCK